MSRIIEFKKNIGAGILLGVAIAITPGQAISDTIKGGLFQTVEGGRGLLFMQSARTFGSSALVMGAKTLAEQRNYPVWWKDTYNIDYPIVLGIPITLGLTDYLDISGSFFVFTDARQYDGQLVYDTSVYGFGSSHIMAKLRFPYPMDSPVQLAVKLGTVIDNLNYQVDGLNYRWIRKGTDYDISLLQTFDLGRCSLHLEEGYTKSTSWLYDDQWVGAAGIEYRPSNRLTLGLEANNRTFDGMSPQSVFQAGLDPLNYYGGAENVGEEEFVKDNRVDRLKDFFIVVPSISYRLNDKVALDFGAAINIADQKKPKETVQIVFGLSYGIEIPWFADYDRDGVKNNIDREPNTIRGHSVNMYGVSMDSDRDGVPDGNDQEKNTPYGAIVDKRGISIDSDGDGVYDGLDREPNTVKGFPVDVYGVSLDTDRDGVPDGIDREKNTPLGVIVDMRGVALDSDGDGVYDNLDKEKNTIKSYPVDAFGVSLDIDKDGVPDGKDLEIDTPHGAIVDSYGVGVDSDDDGVYNGLDREPKTPRGSAVDGYGRALREKERSLLQDGIIRLNAVYFDPGKADLKSESFAALNEAVDIIAKFPNLKIEIQGHSDNIGNSSVNRPLSQKRAQAVFDYIQERDQRIKSSNFIVVGYGSDKPIVSNATPTGRQVNRRVDFVVLNKEVLQNR